MNNVMRSMLQALVLCLTVLAATTVSARSPVSGDQVNAVFWDRTFLAHQGQGRWEERTSSGAVLAFSFIEVYRNNSEIVLHDASRDVDLRIDLNRMAIDYSDAQNPNYRELYKIAGVIDVSGKQHFAAPARPRHGQSENRFKVTKNAGIPGFNTETHDGLSVRQCLDLCAARSWCKSADFERANGRCFLQPVSKMEQPLRTDYPGNPYDHYHRSSH